MKKGNKSPIKMQILKRFFLEVSLVTLIYFSFLLFLDYFCNGFVVDLLYSLFDCDYFYNIFNNQGFVAFLIYIIILLVISVRSILRATKYIEITYKATMNMLNPNTQIENFPSDLKDVEITLKDIKYTIYHNEQLAHEAEQRKNDLVVYLAHDLKTPLTSVIGYLTLLEESPELPIDLRAKYTAITLDKAYRLEQLINEFFDITRFNLQSITLENNHIDLTMMLHQIIDEFYPVFAEKNLFSQTDITANIKIIGDADKLARVFDNLLRNAVNYSYENTCIRITARQENDHVIIKFKNTGDEIPKQKLNSIFEKFFRLDNARSSRSGGAGLGLAIAKQIIELHKGSISVLSNDQYTEFAVVLPIKI